MSPQERSRKTYWLVLLAIVIGIPTMGYFTGGSVLTNPVFLMIMAGVLYLQYRVNRCPHCKKSVDLRSLQIQYCPRCGKTLNSPTDSEPQETATESE